MTFEEKLEKLEELTAAVKNPEISLEAALSAFEEGIKLAKGMEKEIDEIEGKVQILMNQPYIEEENPDTPSKKKAKSRKAKADKAEADDENIIYDKSTLELDMFNAPELND